MIQLNAEHCSFMLEKDVSSLFFVIPIVSSFVFALFACLICLLQHMLKERLITDTARGFDTRFIF